MRPSQIPLVPILINVSLFLESVGDLRFALPKTPLNFGGVRQATSFGAACPQQNITIPGIGPPPSPASFEEDCRTAPLLPWYILTDMD